MQHHTQENIIPHWTPHTQFRNHEQAVLFPHLHKQLKNIHLKLFHIKSCFSAAGIKSLFWLVKGTQNACHFNSF